MIETSDARARHEALRAVLASSRMDGFVVTRADAHQSEVCAPHDDCLAFLTGFTGSAGLALVLADRAILFVDGRYALQVHLEVDAALFEIRHLYDEPLDRWLKDHAMAGWRIGFDPMRVAVDLHDRLQSAMELSGASLVAIDCDPFDAIWKDRPAKPLGLIREMPLAVSGEDSASKRARVAKSIAARGADFLVETLPDNIAWLLNVRGSDVPMNPVPHSFALVDKTGAVEWFVDARKLGNDFDPTSLPGVSISDPDKFLNRVAARSTSAVIQSDPQFSPVAVRLAVADGGGQIAGSTSPITLLKASKNPVELQGYRDCHVEDGVAWVNFLAWVSLEGKARIAAGNPLTELEAEAKLLEFRQERPGFLEPSFRSISACGSNAAMCHYSASPLTNAAITAAAPYLIDSGGQYRTGTTDATRTIMLGPVGEAVRQTYTAVLKGFISLMSAQIPVGTQGHQLDAFARRPLWDLGLDYDHGTGHGVGHNLLVHEYPHRFSKLANPYGLAPGNIMTVEPGYYEAGQYGLRIENQVEVVAAMPGFCRFESLTLAPIALEAADLAALTESEIGFLDRYHARLEKTLFALVRPEALPFLQAETRPVASRD